jgi:hypothetical protein
MAKGRRATWAANVVVLLSLGFLAIAIAWRSSRGAPAPRPKVGVGRLRPAASEARIDEGLAGRGGVRFALPDGWRVDGILLARASPALGDGPELSKVVELASTQIDGILDFRSWLSAESPAGRHYLQYSLNASRGDESCAWIGWATFEAADLGHGSVVVSPALGTTARIHVRLGSGDAAAGALLSIGPPVLAADRAGALVVTDGGGRRTVRGLDRDTARTVTLADGFGPWQGEARVAIPAAPEQEVVLTVPLGGRWDFVRHEARLPFAAASLKLARVTGPDGKDARVWAASRWIPPGSVGTAPFWLMTPKAPPGLPLPVVLEFDGFQPVALEDARTPAMLAFTLDSPPTVSVLPREIR